MDIIYGPFISRQQAKAQGLKQYFTGKPCKHGHIDLREIKKSTCIKYDSLRSKHRNAELKGQLLGKHLLNSIKNNTRAVQFGPYPITYGPFITRDLAKSKGLKQYFEGLPCKHGHIGVCAVSKQHCWTCKTISNRSPEMRESQLRYHQNQINNNRESHRARKNEAMRKVAANRTVERKIEIKRYSQNWLENGGRAWRREYEKELLKKNIQRAISARLRNLVGCRISRKSSSTFDLVGCTVPELITHIESQFEAGMGWENREQWHIDHIRPCASFDLTDPEQQKECFHYNNLQPLWAEENIRKSDNWEPDVN